MLFRSSQPINKTNTIDYHSRKGKFSQEKTQNPFTEVPQRNKSRDSSQKHKNDLNYEPISGPTKQFTTPITLKDLCPEDKAKIGELVKKLAEEKQEKEDLLRKLEDKQKVYESSMKEIRRENEQVVLESQELKEKFKQSLSLLKNLQRSSENNKENMNSIQKRVLISPPRKNQDEKIDTQISSPKREILRITAGESERRLKEIEISRPQKPEQTLKFSMAKEAGSYNKKEFQEGENIQKNLEENTKMLAEIGKLREEIDGLASNLQNFQLLSPPKKTVNMNETNTEQHFPLQKKNENQPKKSLIFQNLQNLADKRVRNDQKKEKSPEINVIENFKAPETEETDSEIEENMEIAKKWLNSKKKKLENPSITSNTLFHKGIMKSPDLEKANLLSQRNLSSLRNYLDKKLEDLGENSNNLKDKKAEKSNSKSEENFDITTPEPQKRPTQVQEPSLVENSVLISEFSSEKGFGLHPKDLKHIIKDSLKKELKNEINDSLKSLKLKEVFEEKLREFLFIKERVLAEEAVKKQELSRKFSKKSSTLDCEEKEQNLNFRKKSNKYQDNSKQKIKEKSRENSGSVERTKLGSSWKPQININGEETEGKISQNIKKSPTIIKENPQKLSFLKEKERKETEEQEEIANLLNLNEDFYENDLFDLIEEIDQKEMMRRDHFGSYKSNRGSQEKPSNNQELMETHSSFTDTDASIRDIKRQISEMEKKKKK